MGMPMQMAQQVPQGITQGVQSGMQQVSQLAGGMVQKDDSQAGSGQQQPGQARDEKPDDNDKAQPTAPEGAAAGTTNAERAPEAAPPKHAAPSDPGIVL
jgi:hypothetical protein